MDLISVSARLIFESLDNNSSSVQKPIALDVGCQRGSVSIKLMEAGYIVHAFEPSPFNIKLIKNNEKISSFQAKNMFSLAECAVANTIGKAAFYYSETNIGINSLLRNHKELQEALKIIVPVTTISEYVKQTNLANVTFMKTDIEGADLLALKGVCIEKNRIPCIVSEFGGRSKTFGYTPLDMFNYMKNHGYTVFINSFESNSKAWRIGDPPQTPRLIYSGFIDKILDESLINWGDALFIDTTQAVVHELINHLNAKS